MDVKLSKNLSWLLRHGAHSEGLAIESDGFVDIQAVLAHKSFRQRNCTVADVLRVVENDQKGRYTVKRSDKTGRPMIKANQGHSIDVADLSLKEIRKSSEIPLAVHGTYSRFWSQIKQDGLKRMRRNHIHFTSSELPADLRSSSKIISGFRSDCDVLVYVDVAKALDAGIPFFLSENNVILSPGENGCISSRFFAKVVDRKSGKLLSF